MSNMSKQHMRGGFTLVEIMVAVSIFATVAVIAIGAVISANDINKKAQAIKTVMDNLNFALDSITLKLKQGGGYYCANAGNFDPSPAYPVDDSSNDCPGGGTAIAFRLANGEASPPQFIYRFYNDKLQLSSNNGSGNMSPFVDIVADEISIESGKFYVVGNNSVDLQPRVLISMYGRATVGRQSSDFAIQTTVSDRR